MNRAALSRREIQNLSQPKTYIEEMSVGDAISLAGNTIELVETSIGGAKIRITTPRGVESIRIVVAPAGENQKPPTLRIAG